VDDHIHALAALRFLVARLDAGRNVRTRPAEKAENKTRKGEEYERQRQLEWMRVRSVAWWTPRS
jgi:hypothetical protein